MEVHEKIRFIRIFKGSTQEEMAENDKWQLMDMLRLNREK
jgi:hypothetical protein